MAKVQRKAKQAIKQIEGKGFEKIGDAYEGVYTARKVVPISDKDGTREAPLYTLQPDEGEAFGIWGSMQLDDLMAQVEVGTYVRIELTGERPPKKKSHSPMKIYEVTPFE